MTNPVRFVAEYIPYAAVERAARRRGWTPDGNDSIHDYVDEDSYAATKSFPNRGLAMAWAKRNRPFDLNSEARVYRQVGDSDAGGWEATDVWHLGVYGEIEHAAI